MNLTRTNLNNSSYIISKESFWHLAVTDSDIVHAIRESAETKTPSDLCTTLHNLFNGKGILSINMLLLNDGLCTFQKQKNIENEEIFERIRFNEFGEKPSRSKCTFLFQNAEDAKKRNLRWFANKRKLIKCHIVMNYPYSICDLDAEHITNIQDGFSVQELENIARNYWNGTRTLHPCIEVLTDADLFFPDWESFACYNLNFQEKIKNGLLKFQN